ncbi:hypothetical protein COT30_05190 [Candidatus Micrarchaeota archaeon CG08_land_8_20_14_0_20_49_17]|nr:MAG: hypothetical protein AUJ13_02755 [Candidatus Micrarchaeota archaeon CG1_02_49_24]PIU09291.1 MAG: hypothetical protein COT30_05190 [Candidatus Micrarchaeota archaeon CG08_land_8_20_14_0_20_49_17]PJA00050.1 MAG: hypothetical protein COX84_00200 [Candidatus Micrarchaeota archaeon CG_4_10_14_0_2_um_filter_49_7]HII53559.1 hypothetical protein [Candidatus Micrarchaeota archaeon]
MQFAKTGQIQNFCHPNALLTFKEYLADYAGPELAMIGGQAIKKELEKIPDRKIREQTELKVKQIDEGKRDLYF